MHFLTLCEYLSGDKLVKSLSGRSDWPEPTEMGLGFTYPEDGLAEIISYVQVDIDLVKLIC